MKKKDDHTTFAAGGMAGARRATGMPPVAAGHAVRRWSVQRKQEVVLQMVQGVPLDELSRAHGVPHYRLKEWRTKALHGLREALKERSKDDPVVAELARAKEHIGELLMKNELLEERLKKGGSVTVSDVQEISTRTSPATGKPYGVQRVCAVWKMPRSSFYAGISKTVPAAAGARPARRRGPRPVISDETLAAYIRNAIENSPFTGEGHRTIHQRITRAHGIHVGRDRVLRLMKALHLL